ncbi:MAG TPA: 50S ribosomal protein L32 [Dehalococcoidia bacterium]|nr:50S ribosomal protein L32 [Dehalococcoidia bacterium]
MAPLPKRKYAKTRQRLRRQHLRPSRAQVSTCPECNSPHQAHHICHECGSYRGRRIFDMDED